VCIEIISSAMSIDELADTQRLPPVADNRLSGIAPPYATDSSADTNVLSQRDQDVEGGLAPADQNLQAWVVTISRRLYP
jgi:hypothetical protein